MSKHIYIFAQIDFEPLHRRFREAVAHRRFDEAQWWSDVQIAVLMIGNYNLAEATDAEEHRERREADAKKLWGMVRTMASVMRR